MTEADLKKLAQFVQKTDFIFDLREARPPISDQLYREAAGWERCVNYIIMMVDNPVHVTTGKPLMVDLTKR